MKDSNMHTIDLSARRQFMRHFTDMRGLINAESYCLDAPDSVPCGSHRSPHMSWDPRPVARALPRELLFKSE